MNVSSPRGASDRVNPRDAQIKAETRRHISEVKREKNIEDEAHGDGIDQALPHAVHDPEHHVYPRRDKKDAVIDAAQRCSKAQGVKEDRLLKQVVGIVTDPLHGIGEGGLV